jgi:superoxide oxidase
MSKTKYHPASIFFHWFVFVLVIAAFVAIELKGQFPKGSEPRELCKTVHGIIGQLIFLVMALRLIVRLTYGAPKPANLKPILASLATAVFSIWW